VHRHGCGLVAVRLLVERVQSLHGRRISRADGGLRARHTLVHACAQGIRAKHARQWGCAHCAGSCKVDIALLLWEVQCSEMECLGVHNLHLVGCRHSPSPRQAVPQLLLLGVLAGMCSFAVEKDGEQLKSTMGGKAKARLQQQPQISGGHIL